MFDKLNEVLDYSIEVGTPGFECLVFHKGQEVFRRRYNYQGGEHLNIYSCSKVITGVVAAQLYEKGLYDLDTPVSEFLPEYANLTVKKEDGSIVPAKNAMTMRNILTMTSGLNYNSCSEFTEQMKKEKGGSFSVRDLAFCKAHDPLQFEPGTSWLYSLGLDVFGATLEVMTGKRFSEYVEENIFKPLGMNQTCYAGVDAKFTASAPQFRYHPKTETAAGYYENIDSGVCIPPNSSQMSMDLGGSGIVTTVDDYMKFLEGWRTGKLLSKSGMEFMMKNHLTDVELQAKNKIPNYPKYGYGIGIRVPSPDTGVTDFGWGGAAGSMAGIDPKREMSFFYAQHVITSPFSSKRMSALYAAQEGIDELAK